MPVDPSVIRPPSPWEGSGVALYPATLTDYVGVGTDDPDVWFHVRAPAAEIRIETEDLTDPTLSFKTINTARQVDVWLDESAVENVLGIGTTLYVDDTNGRVGVGVAPSHTLDAGGDINAANGSGYMINSAATLRHVLIGDGTRGVFRALVTADLPAPSAHAHPHSDLTGIGTDDHHSESHGHSHGSLSGIGSTDHQALVTIDADLAANLLGLSTQELTLDDQNMGVVFAGPALGVGGAAAPTFRALNADDLPALGQIWTRVANSVSTTLANNDVIPSGASGTMGSAAAPWIAGFFKDLYSYKDAATSVPQVRIEQDNAGGDAALNFLLTGGQNFSIGIDNSVTDAFVISSGADLQTNPRITVLPTGAVGIGIASPQELLHVGAGTDASDITATDLLVTRAGPSNLSVRDSTNNVETFLFASSVGGVMGTVTNDPLNIKTNNTSAIFIDASQKVGIRTAAPDSAFHIKANVPGTVGDDYAGQLIIQSPTNDVNTAVVITGYKSDVSGDPDIQLWYLGSSSAGNEDIIFLNRRNAKLALGTNDTHRITILGNGKVGIGTTNPRFLLHLSDGSASGLSSAAGHGMIITEAGTGRIYFEDTGEGAGDRVMVMYHQDEHLRFGSTNDSGASWDKQYVLSINRDGRVGIGTADIPHGGVGAAKFVIDGTNASASGPHVQITTASDNYPLLQLLNHSHDNVHIGFDAYWDGAWKSGDVGSNFAIQKNSDKLTLSYDSSVAQGGGVTFNPGVVLTSIGRVGIRQASPGQILDVLETAGNMIADGYDSHSLAVYKEDLRELDPSAALFSLSAVPPQGWTRTPFVSTEELIGALLTHFSISLEGTESARDRLRKLESPFGNREHLAWVNARKNALRAERRAWPEYQRKHYGLVADDPLTIRYLPELISRHQDTQEIRGYSLGSYVGLLHAAIIDLHTRLEALGG